MSRTSALLAVVATLSLAMPAAAANGDNQQGDEQGQAPAATSPTAVADPAVTPSPAAGGTPDPAPSAGDDQPTTPTAPAGEQPGDEPAAPAPEENPGQDVPPPPTPPVKNPNGRGNNGNGQDNPGHDGNNGNQGPGNNNGDGTNPGRDQNGSGIPVPAIPNPGHGDDETTTGPTRNPSTTPSTGTGSSSDTSGTATPPAATATPTPTPTATPTPAPTPTVVQPGAASPNASAGRPSGRASRRVTGVPSIATAPTLVPLTTAAGPTGLLATASTPAPAATGAPAQPGNAVKKPTTHKHAQPSQSQQPPPVVRTLRLVVEHIPTVVKALIVVLGSLLLISALAWALLARTARYLRRQREHLLGEIGVLQGALLPNVPAELSRLQASVAYRPAEGLAAGGDFYDAFPLDGGRVGIVVGDVAGHGKEALMHTSLLRYTLRAYLEADLEPRVALQLAGRALDRGFDTLATVVLAVYDPARHLLRYASAGHPPPVFLGEPDHVPVTQASAPPIGAGIPTGLRQTSVSLPSGSAVCFFTDGLIEARRPGGEMIGRLGLVEILAELGPGATARELLDRIARDADHVGDDMAACMFRVSEGPNEGHMPRVEELEVHRDEPVEEILGRFLAACGLDEEAIADTLPRARRAVRQFRGAVVRVSLPRGGPRVEVGPANVETLARHRAA